MPDTVGSHSVAAFTSPSNGDALDANVVKGNDNSLRTAYVAHDADPGIHVQSSLLASRPAAGTVGRKWMTTDSGSVKLWYDTGSVWEELATNLTALNASNLTSGTVPDARFSATLPALNGSALTNLNASNLASGTVPDARFPATLPAASAANLTNVMANFAGIASSLELFGITRYITIPIGAMIVWFLVVKGTYESVERIFLFATAIYICYIVSGVLVKPDWKEAALYSVRPVLLFEPGYITLLIGMVGTSVAPWMQFYLQAAIVEKGVSAKEYAESRLEVIVGCVVMTVIAFFIIVACAGAIWSVAPRKPCCLAEAVSGAVAE